MSYNFFKFVHLVGIVLLVGNVTVTAVWKVFADRTGRPEIIAFAQRLVTGTDWVFTGAGIILTMIGGYGMAGLAGLPLLDTRWLWWSQVLFVISGAIWVLCLLPVQIVQSRMARTFVLDDPIPARYRVLGWVWIVAGILATLPLVAAMYLMITKSPS